MSADLRPAENTSLIEPSSFERKANAIIADLRAGKMSKAHGLRKGIPQSPKVRRQRGVSKHT